MLGREFDANYRSRSKTAARLGLLILGLIVVVGHVLPEGANSQSREGQLGAGSAAPASIQTGASTSIIKGQATRISRWPWQVSLAWRRGLGEGSSPRARAFCGGAVIAPRLVLTAGHCVSVERRWGGYRLQSPRKLEIISGRTRLNDYWRGEVTAVRRILAPRAWGYRLLYPNWDVALLVLRRPVAARPIQLAGPDEYRSWAPGRVVWATGWGTRNAIVGRMAGSLRKARQMTFAPSVCRSEYGRGFKPRTMSCLGNPAAYAYGTSTCYGDSGGPIVARVSDGYRLVGLTSFGSDYCWGHRPIGSTRVAANPIRSWIARTAFGATGDRVVGAGALPTVAPPLCRVPNLMGMRLRPARRLARRNGCRVGSIFILSPKARRKGRIEYQSVERGWFGPRGLEIAVDVSLRG